MLWPLARRAALALGLALWLAPAPAGAAFSERDVADIARIEAYLNDIRSLRARFVQVAPNGGLAEGVLSLQRPGRVRFEYAPPTPFLVVGDGEWLFFYDSQLDQITRVKISMTPLKILLDDRIRFGGRAMVAGVQRSPGVLRVEVLDRKKPDDGAVTLVFSDSPLLLRQWLVTDPRGLVTSIYLNRMEVNLPLDPALFVFIDPNPFRDEGSR